MSIVGNNIIDTFDAKWLDIWKKKFAIDDVEPGKPLNFSVPGVIHKYRTNQPPEGRIREGQHRTVQNQILQRMEQHKIFKIIDDCYNDKLDFPACFLEDEVLNLPKASHLDKQDMLIMDTKYDDKFDPNFVAHADSALYHVQYKPENKKFTDIINKQSLDELTEFANDSIFCIKCNNLSYSPILLTCGHTICEGCITDLETNPVTKKRITYMAINCPCCNEEISHKIINYSIRNILDKLEIKCWHDKCNWTGILGNLKDHMDRCKEVSIKCLHCKSTIKKSEFTQHIDNDCSCRKVSCESCSKLGAYKHLESHKKNYCKNRLVKCIKCEEEVKVTELIKHKQTICKFKPINCKYCETTYNKGNDTNHYDKCAEYMVNCYLCNTKVARKNISKHEVQCELKKNAVDERNKINKKYLKRYGKL